MKPLFTLLLLALCSLAFGQAVVINSPQEIAGGYEFEAAAFGRTITDSVWTADAVFVDDGGDIPSQGCNEATNPDEINGKIALIDRGACEFGLKCLNAENAGAVAAIVINTAPGAGAIPMGAGAVGAQVTIPCVMIPYEVGQLIRSAMLSDQIVNISLGDLVPPPPPANDIAISNNTVLVPRYGIIPASQVQQDTDFVFTPGVEVINRGVNDAPNYNISISITHTPFGGTPLEVYSESFAGSESIAAGDTTAFVTFPDFSPFTTGAGVYEYIYDITMDSTDNAAFNNQASGSFTLSENLYSKGTLNLGTGNPNVTATTTLAGGGPVEFITPLDVPYGMDFKIDSVIFDVRRSEGLAGIPIAAYVYEWNDANGDDNIGVEEGEITGIKGITVFTFPNDSPETGASLRLPFLDFETFEETGVIIPGNDMKYLVGVRYEGDQTVTFGFDANIDYDRTVAYKTEQGTATDLDLGFIGAQEWADDGTPSALFIFTDNIVTATGVILTSLISDTEEVVGEDKINIQLFPNPVSDQLEMQVDFAANSKYVEYYGFDATGRMVLHQRKTDVIDTDRTSFNVSQLPAGQYHMVVRTELGIRTSTFVVAR